MAKNYFFPLKKSKILRKISRSGRSSSHLDLRNILSVRPHPPYEKNKLLLNEYLGDFMHFETIFFFFLRKMTFSNPPTPLKCGKFRTFFFFFETFPNRTGIFFAVYFFLNPSHREGLKKKCGIFRTLVGWVGLKKSFSEKKIWSQNA